MEKKTRYRKTFSPKLTIICLIILGIISAFLIRNILAREEFFSIASLIMLIVLWWSTLYSFISSVSGTLKAKRKIAKENKYIKDMNPHIYYRELPNNYGIGVNSLLYDSTMENQKDIVAVILDLCARKYLNLVKMDDKYVVQILKRDTEGLLNNEKYVFNHILTNDLKELRYHDWYMCCLQDGIDLGLYNRQEVHIKNNVVSDSQKLVESKRKKQFKISFVIGILGALGMFSEGGIIVAIFAGLMLFICSYMFLFIPMGISTIIDSVKISSKHMKDIHYKQEMENALKKTENGIEELHKLYSFRAFLNDFGRFVDKSAEEVVLWDRYLSFAQVFGLTEEILASGYDQLINNASFTIDNWEDINFAELEIK